MRLTAASSPTLAQEAAEVLNPLVLVVARGEEGLVVLDEVAGVAEVVAEEEYPIYLGEEPLRLCLGLDAL